MSKFLENPHSDQDKFPKENYPYQYLIDKQIVIRNRSTQIQNCLRISIGTPDENIQLIDALKNIDLWKK